MFRLEEEEPEESPEAKIKLIESKIDDVLFITY